MAGAQLTLSGSFMAGLHFPAVSLLPSVFSEQTALSGDFLWGGWGGVERAQAAAGCNYKWCWC